MIKCGVFDSLGVERSALLSCYEEILESEHLKKRNNVSGQIDMFSMSISGANDLSNSGYQYPEMKEFSLKELLLLEKESSGMYFSGHMIDNYSKAVERMKIEKISVILEDFAEDLATNPTYTDKSTVTVAGIITEKKTKITKNGTTMAFLKLEDRYAEIEVIVFAKNYAKYADDIFVDNAIAVSGNISYEEGEEPRILLSALTVLQPNGAVSDDKIAENTEKSAAEGKSTTEPKAVLQTIYVKVRSLDDSRINNIHRLSALYRGSAQIVLYDESTKKYSKLCGVTVEPSDKVIEKLDALFGAGAVVLK